MNDALGRLISVIDSLNQETSYKYDIHGNVTAVIYETETKAKALDSKDKIKNLFFQCVSPITYNLL